MTIHLAQKIQIALLFTKKFIFQAQYLGFTNIFFKKSVKALFKYIKINKHIIKLKNNKQPFYRLIYSFGLIGLESPKIYIKTNLANNFIFPYKFFINALIIFCLKNSQ